MSSIKSVTVDLHNVPPTEALNVVLKGLPLKFTIRGNTVFVKKDEAPAFTRPAGLLIEARVPVTGRVVDTKGVPILGVSVTVKGTPTGYHNR